MEVVEQLMNIEKKLDSLQNYLDYQNSYKYWTIVPFTILSFMLVYWAVIPIINYLTDNLQPASNLKDALDHTGFIPKDFSIQNALGSVFITAWAINDRTPRFFSKFS